MENERETLVEEDMTQMEANMPDSLLSSSQLSLKSTTSSTKVVNSENNDNDNANANADNNDVVNVNTHVEETKQKKKKRKINRRRSNIIKFEKPVIRNQWMQPWALSANSVTSNPRHQAASQRRENLIKGKKKTKPVSSVKNVSRASGGLNIDMKMHKSPALRELKDLFEKDQKEKKGSKSRRRKTKNKNAEVKEKPNYFSRAYLKNILSSIKPLEEDICQEEPEVDEVSLKSPSKAESESGTNQAEYRNVLYEDPPSSSFSSLSSSSASSSSSYSSSSELDSSYYDTKKRFRSYIKHLICSHKDFKPINCYVTAVDDWSRFE